MTTYDRWFITPAESRIKLDADGNEYTSDFPKYGDNDGISGFSGTRVKPGVVSDHYAALIDVYPDISNWFIVRMYGEDNAGWNALNEIHNYQDTRTLADHENDVKPIMNDHFPDLNKSGQAWAESFKVA